MGQCFSYIMSTEVALHFHNEVKITTGFFHVYEVRLGLSNSVFKEAIDQNYKDDNLVFH